MNVNGAYSAKEARTYDMDREVEPLWHIENAYVSSLLKRVHASRVLDIPVGTGRFFSLYESSEVVGVDLSRHMLHEASQRSGQLSSTISLIEASVTQLPLPQEHFDLVICWRLLHLLPPELLEQAFAELRRVCSGSLSVQCYVPAQWWRKHWAKTLRRMRRVALLAKGNKPALTPWSHIRAWTHTLELISSAARRAGWGEATHTEQLGTYEGTRVLAIEWKA